MKKLLISLIVLFCFTSCRIEPQGEIQRNNVDVINGLEFQTIVYDECEYVMTRRGITHKGNCKFCEERAKKNIHIVY